jgi:hypothetical protein
MKYVFVVKEWLSVGSTGHGDTFVGINSIHENELSARRKVWDIIFFAEMLNPKRPFADRETPMFFDKDMPLEPCIPWVFEDDAGLRYYTIQAITLVEYWQS